MNDRMYLYLNSCLLRSMSIDMILAEAGDLPAFGKNIDA